MLVFQQKAQATPTQRARQTGRKTLCHAASLGRLGGLTERGLSGSIGAWMRPSEIQHTQAFLHPKQKTESSSVCCFIARESREQRACGSTMADQGGFNQFLTAPGPHPTSSAQLLELHKPTVKKLYVESRRMTLERVMEIMQRDHHFTASYVLTSLSGERLLMCALARRSIGKDSLNGALRRR